MTHDDDPLVNARQQNRLAAFYSENGAYLTARHAFRAVIGRIRSRLTASSLGNPQDFSVGQGAVILGASRIRIGRGFVAGPHLWLEAVRAHRGRRYESQIDIGENVTVGNLVTVSATKLVRIGDNVLLGSKIYISDHNHGTYGGPDPSDPRTSPHDRALSEGLEVVIGPRVWIGESVSILPGATIGEGSVIGANSVVTSAIPPFCIAAGAPARVRKRFDFTSLTWSDESAGSGP